MNGRLDLHTEVARSIVRRLPKHDVQHILLARLVDNRQLDRGNPNPGNLGSDFGRFGVALWPAVEARDRRNATRQRSLSELVVWRNAIAHQDFTSPDLRRRWLRLADVRRWRRACDALALHFDVVFVGYLTNLAGVPPW